jgi:hypothetical protein
MKTATNIQYQQVKQRYWEQKNLEKTKANPDSRKNTNFIARSQPIFKYVHSPTIKHKIVQRPEPTFIYPQ